jgi:hypothetical protein
MQLVLYLAHKGGWSFVADVFRDVTLDGIGTPAGARKALKALKCVELDNTGTPVRPTYRCRLRPTLTTLQKLIATLKFNSHAQHDLMQSHYYHSLIPKMIEEFRSAIPRVYCSDIPGRLDPRWRDYAPEGEGNAVTTLTKEESESLQYALMNSPLALSFVLKFIASDEDERTDMIARVKGGLKQFIPIKSDITDVYASAYLPQDRSEYTEPDAENRSEKIMWADIFGFLEYIDDFISDLGSYTSHPNDP